MQLGEIEKSHSGRLHSFMNAILDTPENGQFSVLIILVSLQYLLTSGLNWSVRVCRNRASKQILWFLWKVLHDPDVNFFSRLPNLTRFNVLSIWWQNAVFSVIPLSLTCRNLWSSYTGWSKRLLPPFYHLVILRPWVFLLFWCTFQWRLQTEPDFINSSANTAIKLSINCPMTKPLV